MTDEQLAKRDVGSSGASSVAGMLNAQLCVVAGVVLCGVGGDVTPLTATNTLACRFSQGDLLSGTTG